MNLLSTSSLSKYFGGIHALEAVDVNIEKGQIHGLIGPNGSGKTTFFNVVTNILPATYGKIYFDGMDITNLNTHIITKLGISRTFQRAIIMPMLSCRENVMLGMHSRSRIDLLGTFFRLPLTNSTQESLISQRALELLEFVGLANAAENQASDLVWVETQQLQIARALATEPKLLLLDEPTGGMGLKETEKIDRIIREVRDTMGITVLVVSHDINLLMGITDWVTVLNFGKKLFEGTPVQVQKNQQVCEAYLGRE